MILILSPLRKTGPQLSCCTHVINTCSATCLEHGHGHGYGCHSSVPAPGGNPTHELISVRVLLEPTHFHILCPQPGPHFPSWAGPAMRRRGRVPAPLRARDRQGRRPMQWGSRKWSEATKGVIAKGGAWRKLRK